MELLTNSAFLALLGTIFGGVGLKVLENLLNRSKDNTDVATSIRAELRVDVLSLRQEIRTIEKELDIWKEKYYNLLDQFYKKGWTPEDVPPFHDGDRT